MHHLHRMLVLGAFVGCTCFAFGCVPVELVVCRVRFARVSCPRLRFGIECTRPEEGMEMLVCYMYGLDLT